MSPRAAWRLETLGFREVYDYEGGKSDWAAFGLPREGTAAAAPSAGDLARRDVPTCSLGDDLHDVRERVRAAGWDTCFVVTDDRVVLGRLGRRALAADDHATVEAAMSEGPSTVRPGEPVAALLGRMERGHMRSYPVTTADGRLVGLVRREDVEGLPERVRSEP